jgi:hypothetical protein
MKTATKATRSAVLAGAAATLAIAAMGFAGAAQARDNVYWSVGVGNAGAIYQPPVYVQPQPVYVEPAPVYYQPQPVYVRPAPVYYAPQPIYYERPHYRHRREGFYQQAPRGYYGQGYAPAYYQREGWRDHEHGNQHGNHED